MSKPAMRYYEVQASEPAEYLQRLADGTDVVRASRRNLYLGVMATSGVKALELAMAAHPDMEIHQFIKRGTVDLWETTAEGKAE